MRSIHGELSDTEAVVIACEILIELPKVLPFRRDPEVALE